MTEPNHEKYASMSLYLKDYRKYLYKTRGDDYTQTKVAAKCKVHPQFISNIERGLCLPPVSLAIQLFELYGLDKMIAYDFFLKERANELKKWFSKEEKYKS